MGAASKLWPWLLKNSTQLNANPQGVLCGILPASDEVLFVAFVCLLLLYALITHLLGTHLWGCFVAGVSLACLQPQGHAHRVWAKQTEQLTTWMVRLFFTCTVAFSVPIDPFFSLDVFWKGLLLGVGPCIIAKVISAAWLGHELVSLVGCAMVGRGELAYLIAWLASASGPLTKQTYCVVLWALLWASASAPLVFSCVLGHYIKRDSVAHNRATSDQSGGKQLDGFLDNLADGAGGSCSLPVVHEEPNKSQNVFDSEAAMGNDNWLHDLEAIKVNFPENSGLSPSTMASNERKAWHDAAGCGGCGEKSETATECSSYVPSATDSASPGTAGFPGANNGIPTGFLCCLFFKKVVME